MTLQTTRETRLFLVRHGETDANVAGVWQGGQGDDPLNDRGQQQSAAVASYLAHQGPIATVYTSPQRRARQTAEAIAQAKGIPIVEVGGLREYDIGDMEGVTAEEIARLWASFVEKWRTDPDLAPPGGESARQFTQRLHAALSDVIREAAGQTVVVVSHQGVLATGLAVLVGQPDCWKEYQMANCAVTLLVCGGDEPPCVERFNVTEHLSGIGTEVWDGHRQL
jgi:probable phosphoglycerate mutase